METILNKYWRLWALFVLVACCVSSTNGDRHFCYKGRFLATPKAAGQPRYCTSCAPKTFIPDEIHNHTECFPCTQVQHPELERLLTPCNKSHDTVIHCIDGYYRPISLWPDERVTCMKCKNCSVIQSPCQKFQDTKCCPGDNYEVRINATGQSVCVQLCGAGQFLNSVDNQCVTCTEGTYMDEDRHINQYCKTCAIPTSPLEKLVRPCTSTQTSVIGCVDGFYRRRQSDNSPVDVCVPCSNCFINTDGDVHEGRSCGEWKDTVCCPQPNMTVIDTSDGPECAPIEHQTERDSTDGKTGDEIVGILIGIFVPVGLGIAVVIFLCTRRSYKKASAENTTNTPAEDKVCRQETPAQDNSTLPLLPDNQDDTDIYGREGSNNVPQVKPDTIPLKTFTTKSLPEAYCDDKQRAILLLNMVKHLAELTVHLIVPESSQNRCQNFRNSDAGKEHTGCGWVQRITRSSGAQQSVRPESPEGAHEDGMSEPPSAELIVCTAASVVFNIEEGRHTKCVFKNRSELEGAKKVISDHGKDWCYLIFETDNEKLIESLEKNREQFNRLRYEVLFKFNIVKDPYESEELSCKLDCLYKEYMNRIQFFDHLFKNIRDATRKASSVSVTDFGRRVNLESLGLCKFIASEEKVDDKNQYILSMIENSEALRRCRQTVVDLKELKKKCKSFTPGSNEQNNAWHKYRKWCLEAATLGRSLHLFKCISVHHWGHKTTHKYPRYDYRYNERFPLTIIITFKKTVGDWETAVKLGQVTQRKSMWFDHHSIYCYNNLTEPGDEGAPVLVMGNTELSCHGHSGKLAEMSESGAWSDLIPCIADLSASAPVENKRI